MLYAMSKTAVIFNSSNGDVKWDRAEISGVKNEAIVWAIVDISGPDVWGRGRRVHFLASIVCRTC